MGRKRKAESRTEQLTDKELAFVHEYSKDWNKKQAAIRAGYAEETAAELGFEIANKPHVSAAVRKIQNDRAKKLELSVEWTVDQFYDLYQTARNIGDFKNATKALENIAKILGAYLKDNEQKHGIKSQAEADAIREKLKARGMVFEVANAPSAN